MGSSTKQELTVEQKLASRPIVTVESLRDIGFRRATKTKPVKAKHVKHLLNADQDTIARFLLDTIEGKQALKGGNTFVVVGEAGDAWQQDHDKLFGKYNVEETTEDGWMVCYPKPDNEIDGVAVPDFLCGPDGFAIIGQWGERAVVEGQQVSLQYGIVGDIVAQHLEDADDRWIVVQGLFRSTYDWK